jgi:hypothetical protein
VGEPKALRPPDPELARQPVHLTSKGTSNFRVELEATIVLRLNPIRTLARSLMDVLYIRRSLAWIRAIVFGHVSEFQQGYWVKTILEAARTRIRR